MLLRVSKLHQRTWCHRRPSLAEDAAGTSDGHFTDSSARGVRLQGRTLVRIRACHIEVDVVARSSIPHRPENVSELGFDNLAALVDAEGLVLGCLSGVCLRWLAGWLSDYTVCPVGNTRRARA